MIVIPVLLTNTEEIQSLVAQLERALPALNADPNLGFALLTDLPGMRPRPKCLPMRH